MYAIRLLVFNTKLLMAVRVVPIVEYAEEEDFIEIIIHFTLYSILKTLLKSVQ